MNAGTGLLCASTQEFDSSMEELGATNCCSSDRCQSTRKHILLRQGSLVSPLLQGLAHASGQFSLELLHWTTRMEVHASLWFRQVEVRNPMTYQTPSFSSSVEVQVEVVELAGNPPMTYRKFVFWEVVQLTEISLEEQKQLESSLSESRKLVLTGVK